MTASHWFSALKAVFITFCFLPLTAGANLSLATAAVDQDVELLLKPEVHSPGADVLRDDFRFLQEKGVFPPDTRLRVKQTEDLAQTLDVDMVVVSEHLAQLPRLQRLFVLAHEASHARHEDRQTSRAFLAEQLPRYLTHTDLESRRPEVYRQFQARAHEQEFRADAEARQVLRSLGFGKELDIAVDALFRRFAAPQSLTHPSSEERRHRPRAALKTTVR